MQGCFLHIFSLTLCMYLGWPQPKCNTLYLALMNLMRCERKRWVRRSQEDQRIWENTRDGSDVAFPCSIGENIQLLVDRPDGTYCFRLHRDRVYYVR